MILKFSDRINGINQYCFLNIYLFKVFKVILKLVIVEEFKDFEKQKKFCV